MKIAFVLQTLGWGGAARAATNLAGSLIMSGHTVTIVTMQTAESIPYALHPKINIINSGLAQNSTTPFSSLRNTWSRIQYLRKLSVKEDLDVVVGLSYTANVLVALACLGLSVCSVGSERSHPEQKKIPLIWKYLCKVLYSQLDLLVALTVETKTWLENNTYVKNVTVIPNGITLPMEDGESIDRFERYDPARKYLISTGRIIDTKQLDQFVSAYAELADEFTEWDCIILGEGPKYQELSEYIETLGLGSRIIMPGAVGNIGYWLNKADIYISTSSLEGFPNGLLEGMAHGLAAISYDCRTGPSDLIIDQETGYLIELNNLDSLGSHLRRLMSDCELRQSFGTAARQDIKNRFGMHQVVRMWEGQLNSMLDVT